MTDSFPVDAFFLECARRARQPEKPEVPPTEAPAPQEGGEKKEKKKGPTKAELKAIAKAEKEAAAKAEAEAKAAKLLTLAPEIFGKKPVIASTTNKSLKLTNFNELADNVEKTVTVRARIHGSRKQGGKMALQFAMEWIQVKSETRFEQGLNFSSAQTRGTAMDTVCSEQP